MESWRIWIDYNHDGDFNDVNELIVQYSNNYNYDYHNFTVPANALSGTTRMRVSMKAGANHYSTPCEMLTDGEVEDYTVNIIASQPFTAAGKVIAMNPYRNGLTLSPNPAANFVHLSLNRTKAAGNIKMFDLQGKMIKQVQVLATNNIRIDVSSIAAGIYVVQVTDVAGNNHYTRFVKQ